MAKLISSVYGEALFKVALEKQQMEVFQEEAEGLWRVWVGYPDFTELLDSPRIGMDEKLQALDSVFRGRITDELMSLVTILLERGRQKELPAVCAHFIELVNAYKKTGTAHVYSAAALKPEQKARVEQKLLETTSFVSLRMDYKVDTSLLGGLIIQIGDRVVDGSVKTRLEKLKKNLSSSSV